MLTEGAAMWHAMYEDLSTISGVEVYSLRDARLPPADRASDTTVANSNGTISTVDAHVREAFFNLAISCDATLVIAPEFDRHMFKYTQGIEAFGVSLLSPNSQFIEIASDKNRTCTLLTDNHIRVPLGRALMPHDEWPNDFELPFVMKVNDGAGSMCELVETETTQSRAGVMRIEQLVKGSACSVSFLCRGANSPIACPPMSQILSADGKFQYLGGTRVMDRNLANRASNLATKAIRAMPPTTGYAGVDLVMGDDEDGSGDYVIEINPRLTTSYLGLRRISNMNLAEAMLTIARGEDTDVTFQDAAVSFGADGTIR